MSSGEKPHIVRFGEGVSMTHPDDPMSGRFLTEEDMAGGRPTIGSPLPLRQKALGPGTAEEKSGGVDPFARVTSGAVTPRGDENHSPLTRNPYAGTPNAADYENGYEHAQSLGHQVLGQLSPQDLARWQRASPAWRQGLADAAKALGVGNITDTLGAQGKTAMRAFFATEYFQTKTAEKEEKSHPVRAAGIGAALGGGAYLGARHALGAAPAAAVHDTTPVIKHVSDHLAGVDKVVDHAANMA